MESVAHHCRTCGKTPEQTGFRLNGSGVPRADCNACENAARIAKRQPWREQSTALVPSRIELVDINGSELPAVFVNEWQRYWPVKAAVEATGVDWEGQRQRMQRDKRLAQGTCIIKVPSRAGGAQDTVCLPWDAWHYFWTTVTDSVNDAARPAVERIKDEAYAALAMVFGDGPKVLASPAFDTTLDPALLAQVGSGLITIFQTVVERAIDRRMGPMPQQTAETWETVRGATVIEREVVRETTIEWMGVGRVYLAVERGKGLMSVGMVLGDKTPEMRMKDPDYNGNKSEDNHWEAVWSFWSDKPRGIKKDPGAEQIVIGYVRRMGVEQLTEGGRFRYDERVEVHFKRLPPKLKFVNLHRWIEQAGLFPELLFVVADA